MMLKRVLNYTLLVLLFLPLAENLTGIIPIRPLNGDFKTPAQPNFTKTGWFAGSFQDSSRQFLENTIGFRNVLVRCNNQLDFSLFNKAHAEGIVIGKDNNLFEKDYIRAYLGGDFIGELAVEKKLRRLKYLQELFKTKGKNLILVFEPGKASFSPEFIPDNFYDLYPPGRSNYQAFVEKARELNINYLDFNDWFKKMKPTAPYPLYPKTGVHWSAYGMILAADSLLHYLEKVRGIHLPDLVTDSFMISHQAMQTDNDAGKALNLLCGLSNPPLAYPAFHFRKKPGDSRLSVLTVADSYYWNIFNTRLPLFCYRNEAFWYFNTLVYPDSYYGEKKVESLDIKAEVEKQDVVFLMVTERFLYKFDWNFIDNLFDLYTPELEKDYPYQYEGKIRGFSDWFDLIVKKAGTDKVPVYQALHDNAVYTFRCENKEKYLLYYGPVYYDDIIRANKEWMVKEWQKAREARLPLNTIIKRDCRYLFRNELPELYKLYYALQDNIRTLRNDPACMQKIIHNPYFLRPEDMLWQVALSRAKGDNQSLALMTW
ncbi:MAG: hypothetical protein NTU44_14540 [Bacteroidetes bacterium]|nr:hypothetical protein [Bacteroidota bacterium]